jgi:hypothetical protein
MHFTNQLTDFWATLYTECVKSDTLQKRGGGGEVPWMVGLTMPKLLILFLLYIPLPVALDSVSQPKALATCKVYYHKHSSKAD